MPILTREQIDAADDLPCEEFAVEEWGGDVLLQALSAGQRQEVEHRCSLAVKGKPEAIKDLKVTVVAMALIDSRENRKPLYSEKELTVLQKRSAAAIERIFDHVWASNKFAKSDAAGLAKN